ncbi:hypothetical protein [Clostridium neonatale]|nr:hypothetical protein [Clostridium neonatale]CAI3606373.1 hypothetical protein CNEO3_260068 [Clostridium neonatale]CAI3635870.1 hypothetical protein CNEO3_300067 [Clostridium neonatale]CAI3637399.1 hypothetical protein CNEO3_280067 [Clostridium neonatale]CAI3638207.1 hypothetical protein CNEO3_340061 [Clostridium neonatale]CAI3682202.1 hypothetical protein CNEO4_950018 [Clostridium neonatale]
MRININEKEIAIINLVLHTCKVLMNDSNKGELESIIKKINGVEEK